ncbi:MAG: c-type cytochrome [Betaproteobacteria bacterium]|nr:c-type cytochrome [Betaproteobacteria bacterium]
MRLALKWMMAILAAATTCSAASATTSSKRINDIINTRCSTCHGPTGQSSNAEFPKLAGQNADYLIRQMFNFKSRARKSNEMEKEMAGLSGNDIEKLANYFSLQQLIPVPRQDRALIEAGRNFYMAGDPERGISACAVCHGPKARGGKLLPRLAGQHARYLELQLRHFLEQSRTTDQTLMHSIASKMTDDEILAVSYFLSGLD